MGRWIALGITLVCFGSCSFMSQSTFRGMVAPIGVIVDERLKAQEEE